MKKLILTAIGAVMSLPLLALTSTTSTTTTSSPAKVKEVTTTTTTREETPVSEQLTMEKTSGTSIPQSMEEAPATVAPGEKNELSSPELVPHETLPLEQREEDPTLWDKSSEEKQKMEDLNTDEDDVSDEFVPNKVEDDVEEEEEY